MPCTLRGPSWPCAVVQEVVGAGGLASPCSFLGNRFCCGCPRACLGLGGLVAGASWPQLVCQGAVVRLVFASVGSSFSGLIFWGRLVSFIVLFFQKCRSQVWGRAVCVKLRCSRLRAGLSSAVFWSGFAALPRLCRQVLIFLRLVQRSLTSPTPA